MQVNPFATKEVYCGAGMNFKGESTYSISKEDLAEEIVQQLELGCHIDFEERALAIALILDILYKYA